MGKVIEPIVHPMGVDWRVGVGLISAFAAREVFRVLSGRDIQYHGHG